MIKTKKGKIAIKGTPGELMADLAVIVHELFFDVLLTVLKEDDAKDLIRDTVENGMLTKEQMTEKMLRDIAKIINEESEDEAE